MLWTDKEWVQHSQKLGLTGNSQCPLDPRSLNHIHTFFMTYLCRAPPSTILDGLLCQHQLSSASTSLTLKVALSKLYPYLRNMKGPCSTRRGLRTLAGTVIRSGTLDSLIARYVVSCGQVAFLGLFAAWKKFQKNLGMSGNTKIFTGVTSIISSRPQAFVSIAPVPLGKVRVGASGPGNRDSVRISWVLLTAVAHQSGSFTALYVGARIAVATMGWIKVMPGNN